jgi:alkanesulfonate monooxygenase SsuD/methylene tetrahydromethanopterin reductase-like flavin-dependent oxidoreductase (luciferase family)
MHVILLITQALLSPPLYLMLLREPRLRIDTVSETYTAAEFSSPEEYAHVMRERMQSAYRLVHDHLKAAFAKDKRRIRIRECQFKVGDQVWYFSPRKYGHRSPKWSLQTSGPFEVVRRVNDVNYVIRKSNRHPSFTVHIDRLRRYSGSAGADPSFPVWMLRGPIIQRRTTRARRALMNGLLVSVAHRSECESTSGEIVHCIAFLYR